MQYVQFPFKVKNINFTGLHIAWWGVSEAVDNKYKVSAPSFSAGGGQLSVPNFKMGIRKKLVLGGT